ncbi:MAG: ExbD/TolR family protein [Thermoguttaceae bacterium]
MCASILQKTKAEPNLTPILDMVFQLITFFMLVINFKSASLDLSLKLPVVGSALPVDSKGESDLLILNIASDGQLIVYGIPKPDIEAYISGEAEASRLWARRTVPNFQRSDDLPSTVVIRADKSTPFKLVNRVIKACQGNGYRKFAMKALNKE